MKIDKLNIARFDNENVSIKDINLKLVIDNLTGEIMLVHPDKKISIGETVCLEALVIPQEHKEMIDFLLE